MQEAMRINRRLENAASLFSQIRSARNPTTMQGLWENFLIQWRSAVEMLADYAKRHDQQSTQERRHQERLNSPTLDYVWEARNAEYHDARGSAEVSPGGFSINAQNPGQPLYIKSLHLTSPQNFHQDIASAQMTNASVEIREGRMEMQPVYRTVKKQSVKISPPFGKTPAELAAEALEFAYNYAAELKLR